MARGWLANLLALLLGVILSASLLLVLDRFCGYLHRRWPRPATGLKATLSLDEETSRAGEAPTHVAIHLPPRISSGRGPGPASPPVGEQCIPGVFSFDPSCGSIARANVSGRAIKTLQDGSKAYDVVYHIDSESRRRSISHPRASRHLFTFGCSWVFGQGLQDEETLASRIAALAPSYQPYNYAFMGWGPSNNLRRVEKPGFAADVPERKGISLYVFVNFHMQRLLGSLSIKLAVPAWLETLPYYYLDSQGELSSDGFIGTARPFRSFLFDLLARSDAVQYFNIDVPPRLTARHIELAAKVLQRLRDDLRATLDDDFYVVIYPGSHFGRYLVPMLDRLNIRSLDYSQVNALDYFEGPASLPDGHPSAEANQFLARQIVRDLGLGSTQGSTD